MNLEHVWIWNNSGHCVISSNDDLIGFDWSNGSNEFTQNRLTSRVLTFQILSSRFGEETNKHMPSFCSDDDDSSKLYWNLFTSEGNVSQFYTKNASCWTLLLLRIEKRIEKKFNTSNYLGELLSGELIRVQI